MIVVHPSSGAKLRKKNNEIQNENILLKEELKQQKDEIENMNLKAVELEDEALYTAVSIAMRKDDEISQRAKEFIRLFGTQGLKSPH